MAGEKLGRHSSGAFQRKIDVHAWAEQARTIPFALPGGVTLHKVVSVVAFFLASVSGLQAKDHIASSLLRLDPTERLLQVCDLEAMRRIGGRRTAISPDRAVVGAVSAPTINGDSAQGSGGALRSKGRWYHFTFTCRTAPDHMRVLSFEYELGGEIPEQKWSQFGLWK